MLAAFEQMSDVGWNAVNASLWERMASVPFTRGGGGEVAIVTHCAGPPMQKSCCAGTHIDCTLSHSNV